MRVLVFVLMMAATQLAAAQLSLVRAQSQQGIAAVYSLESGSGIASGQKLNPEALTAAHRTLPFGTKVRVTNRKNSHSVTVTINDRGPFTRGRIIDLTPAAARALGFSGLAQVTLEIEG
jgi:rare lipoprotein A